jgi:hypothetical protein
MSTDGHDSNNGSRTGRPAKLIVGLGIQIAATIVALAVSRR